MLLSVPHLLSDPESSGLHSHPAPAPVSASSGAAETLCRNGSHSVAGLQCLHPSPEKGLETPGLEFVRGKDNENIFIKKKNQESMFLSPHTTPVLLGRTGGPRHLREV